MDKRPLGPDALNMWLRRRAIAADLERQVIRIAAETGIAMPRPGRATAAGDPDRLRGLPAVGPGIGGAIRGSRPEGELLRVSGDWAG